MSSFVASVHRDEEVLESIRRQVASRGVINASIVLIGAVQECTVSVMPNGDPLGDILVDYDQPFELTGTGEVVDGKVHVHVTLGGEGRVIAGHLHRAMVRDWFVRAYVHPIG